MRARALPCRGDACLRLHHYCRCRSEGACDRLIVFSVLYSASPCLFPRMHVPTRRTCSHMVGATVAVNSCLAVRGNDVFSLFRHMATARPLAAALAMCSFTVASHPSPTPRVLALCLGQTSFPLITNGVSLVRSALRGKCTMVVLSPSNVAPFRFSQFSALSMMA
jgi:hypothetical protein